MGAEWSRGGDGVDRLGGVCVGWVGLWVVGWVAFAGDGWACGWLVGWRLRGMGGILRGLLGVCEWRCSGVVPVSFLSCSCVALVLLCVYVMCIQAMCYVYSSYILCLFKRYLMSIQAISYTSRMLLGGLSDTYFADIIYRNSADFA